MKTVNACCSVLNLSMLDSVFDVYRPYSLFFLVSSREQVSGYLSLLESLRTEAAKKRYSVPIITSAEVSPSAIEAWEFDGRTASRIAAITNLAVPVAFTL